jgi:AraC-like DNA-binding protein
MNSIPLIRVNTFLPFVVFLNRLGSPTGQLLKQAKLPTFALNDPEALIPRHLAFEFARQAARREGIENLGLLVGQKTSIVNLGAFGRLISQSLTLYDALNTLILIAPATNSGEIYWLNEGGERAWFCQQYLQTMNTWPGCAVHYSSMLIVDLIQIAAGKGWQPQEIYLQSYQIRGLTQGLTESAMLGDLKIQAGARFTAVAFPRSFLSLPFPSLANPCHEQRQQDYEILQSSAPAPDFPCSLRQAIATLLREGYPDIHLASEITRMPVRTLQRRLAEEGLTYSRLVEQARFAAAVRWLEDPTLKLVDIAAELGYTDAAHFTHAFKRWTGISPSEFRRQRWG